MKKYLITMGFETDGPEKMKAYDIATTIVEADTEREAEITAEKMYKTSQFVGCTARKATQDEIEEWNNLIEEQLPFE